MYRMAGALAGVIGTVIDNVFEIVGTAVVIYWSYHGAKKMLSK